MDEELDDIRDLRVDVFIGENGRRYRVTHIPSEIYAESDVVAEAVDSINKGLNGP